MSTLQIISTACAVSYIQASDAPLPPTSSLVSQSAKTYHSVFTDQNFFHNDTTMDFSQGVTNDQEESEAISANPIESAIFGEKSWYDDLAVKHEKDLDGSASDIVTDKSLEKRMLNLSDNVPSASNHSVTEALPDPSARIGSYVAYIPIPFGDDISDEDSSDDDEYEYEDYEDEDEYEDYDEYEEDKPNRLDKHDQKYRRHPFGSHSSSRESKRKSRPRSRRRKTSSSKRDQEDHHKKMPFLVPLMMMPDQGVS